MARLLSMLAVIVVALAAAAFADDFLDQEMSGFITTYKVRERERKGERDVCVCERIPLRCACRAKKHKHMHTPVSLWSGNFRFGATCACAHTPPPKKEVGREGKGEKKKE